MRRSRAVGLIAGLFVCASLTVAGPSSAEPRYPVVAKDVSLSPGAAAEIASRGHLRRAPMTFSMVALSSSEAHAEYLVRAHGDDGWTEWTELEADPGESPDPGRPGYSTERFFTSPLWTREAQAVQIRLADGGPPPRNVKIHFLDTTGAALSTTQRLAAWFRPRLEEPPAMAATPMPLIYTRKAWGADESVRQCGPDYGRVKGAFIHHTATGNSYSPSEAAGIIRGIYHFHVKSRDFCDIGYNFLIDRYGRIWEGAYGGMHRSVWGAHASEYNRESTGISVIGNFVGVQPPSGAIDAIVRLLNWKFSRHDVLGNDIVKYWTGRTLPTIAGHRDVKSTSCPGDIYPHLPAIRKRVKIDITHPEGALVKGSRATVYYIEDGRKRPLASASILESQFRWRELIGVTNGSITDYPGGALMGFREGILIRIPRGTVYVISGGSRRGFTSAQAFEDLGYRWSNVIEVTDKQAEIHPLGIPVAIGPHPDGTLVKGSKAGVYFLEEGQKRGIPSAAVFESQFRWSEIVRISDGELGAYPGGDLMGFRDGVLIRVPRGTVYVISEGLKRGFPSARIFEGMAYKWTNILEVSDREANLHDGGPLVDYK